MSEQEKSGYDRSKDVVVAKFSSKSEKRYMNVVVYNYDNKGIKLRINPANKNTNTNQTDPKKQWINVPGISGFTKDEVKDLIINLEKALTKM